MSVKIKTTTVKEVIVSFKPKLIEDAFINAIMGQLHSGWPEGEGNLLEESEYINQTVSQIRRNVSDMLEAQWHVADDEEDIEIGITLTISGWH